MFRENSGADAVNIEIKEMKVSLLPGKTRVGCLEMDIACMIV